MADEADISQDRIELQESLRRKYSEPLTIPQSNVCLNCGEPTGIARWCDLDCQVDYLKRAK